MTDHVLPPSGGWIIIRRKLPTEIQVPLLSMFYAMPDRLFPAGWHTIRWAVLPGMQYSPEQLKILWRHRHRGKLSASEIELCQSIARYEEQEEKTISLDMRVQITTTDGQVCLEPHEWVPAGDMQPFYDHIDGEHITLHELGGTNTGNLEEYIFYLQTRGISKFEALRLLLGEVKRPNVFWLELNPEYANQLIG